MLRNRLFNYRFGLTITTAAVLGAAVLTGCSSGGGGDYGAPMPSGPTAAAKKPASGPAITDKLKFDQLALDSPVRKVTIGGASYLQFKYTDMEGIIHTCELPEGHSRGEYLPADWISTFNIYKKPETVVVKKREVKKTDQGVVDFPFVSPKPIRVESQNQETQSSQETQSNPSPQHTPAPMPGGTSIPSP